MWTATLTMQPVFQANISPAWVVIHNLPSICSVIIKQCFKSVIPSWGLCDIFSIPRPMMFVCSPYLCLSALLSVFLSVFLPACLHVSSIQSMDSSDLSDGPITLQEYLEVKKALASSEAKVQQLMKVNNNLSEELRRLQKEVGSM